jgi:hypothetical protein
LDPLPLGSNISKKKFQIANNDPKTTIFELASRSTYGNFKLRFLGKNSFRPKLEDTSSK